MTGAVLARYICLSTPPSLSFWRTEPALRHQDSPKGVLLKQVGRALPGQAQPYALQGVLTLACPGELQLRLDLPLRHQTLCHRA